MLNQISGNHSKPQSGSHGSSHGSGGLGGLANQLIGGIGGGSHGGSHGSSSGGHNSGNPGKLVGQLASNLFSSGHNKPEQQSQNYNSGQAHPPQHSGGLGGQVMGGVANMFGGHHGNKPVSAFT